MNNVIAYVAPKNNTMAHSMSLKNRISCVVGISIFGFKTYCKQVFDLMEIQTSSTFEQFLQAETLNSKKNKSYWIRRQATESLPQAGNDQTINIRQYACKAKWDGL